MSNQNTIPPYEGSGLARPASAPARVSARVFNLLVSGLLFVGFCVMGLEVRIAAMPAFLIWASRNTLLYLLGPVVLSIVGLVVMNIARSRQSVGMSLAGYAVFIASFGFTVASLVAMYDMPTVQLAFFATAGITVVFGALGLAFPQVFQRIGGALMVALVAIIVAQIILAVVGAGSQTWLDGIVVLVFGDFVAYDMYRAATVEPTVPNAVLAACDLYLDIVNIFVHLLSIFDRD